jgi:hypothetical protein
MAAQRRPCSDLHILGVVPSAKDQVGAAGLTAIAT